MKHGLRECSVKVFCDILRWRWHRCKVQSSAEITQGMVSVSGISEARGVGLTCDAVRNLVGLCMIGLVSEWVTLRALIGPSPLTFLKVEQSPPERVFF